MDTGSWWTRTPVLASHGGALNIFRSSRTQRGLVRLWDFAHAVSSTWDVSLFFPLINSYSSFKAQLTRYLICLSV